MAPVLFPERSVESFVSLPLLQPVTLRAVAVPAAISSERRDMWFMGDFLSRWYGIPAGTGFPTVVDAAGVSP